MSGGRDHGGDLDRAAARYGAGDWLDLSTGINPRPYPVGAVPDAAWARLPTRADLDALTAAARAAYGTAADCVPLAGAQAAIQIVPRLRPAGVARVLGPTYNEHAAALATAGWTVVPVPRVEDLAGADLAVVVNPNNPDGRRQGPEDLRRLADRVGLLVVDESFADPDPGLSLAPDPGPALVLRSFGKFYGLAGLRLGFAIAAAETAARIAALAGPWAVSGPAIAVGTRALGDADWRARTIRRLAADADRLDGLAAARGWSLVGGTPLFRTYGTEDAAAVRDRLARGCIWSRIFPYDAGWIRLGLPGTAADWDRLAAALAGGGE